MQKSSINIYEDPLKDLVELLSPAGKKRVIASMRKRIAKELVAEGVLEPRKNGEQKRAHQGAKWTREDDATLCANYKSGGGAVAIAALMGRSVPGIAARVVRLGMEEHRKKVRR